MQKRSVTEVVTCAEITCVGVNRSYLSSMFLFLLKLILGLAATTLVLLDQIKRDDEFRSRTVWIAIFCMVATMFLIVGEHVTGSKAERENKADLVYIQKLGAQARNLCFQLNLRPTDPVHDRDLTLQLHWYVQLAPLFGTGLYTENLFFAFSRDSGWHYCGAQTSRWKNTAIVFDSSANHVRLVLEDFCIAWKERIMWQPDDIGDLERMKLEFALHLEWDDSLDFVYTSDGKGQMLVERQLGDWCPISEILVYVNDFDEDNLLVTASELADISYGVKCFVPIAAPGGNVRSCQFQVDPLWLRENILKSLD